MTAQFDFTTAPNGREPNEQNFPLADLSDHARNGTLDMLRLVAAAVIVLFHAKSAGGEFVGAALGVFTVTVCYLSGTRNRDLGWGEVVRQRAARLLVPFAIWGALYLSLRVADAVAQGEPILRSIQSWYPPKGTMGQLWFMPFAYVVSLAAYALSRSRASAPNNWLVLPLMAAISATWLVFLQSTELPQGFLVFFELVPAALFGMALSRTKGCTIQILATGVAAFLLGLLLGYYGVDRVQQLVLGVPLVTLALVMRTPGNRTTFLAAELSLAIYLVHIFVMAVLLRLLPIEIGSNLLGPLALVFSTALGLGLLRLPIRRFLF